MKNIYLAGLTASRFTLDRNLEGITQIESLEQPRWGGNCINWNAGHILIVRQQLLSKFGTFDFLTSDESKCYISGSTPISIQTPNVDIDRIRQGLDFTFTALQGTISKLDDGFFEQPIPADQIPVAINQPNFAKLLVILLYHEGYHTGQIGLGRRMLGKPFSSNL